MHRQTDDRVTDFRRSSPLALRRRRRPSSPIPCSSSPRRRGDSGSYEQQKARARRTRRQARYNQRRPKAEGEGGAPPGVSHSVVCLSVYLSPAERAIAEVRFSWPFARTIGAAPSADSNCKQVQRGREEGLKPLAKLLSLSCSTAKAAAAAARSSVRAAATNPGREGGTAWGATRDSLHRRHCSCPHPLRVRIDSKFTCPKYQNQSTFSCLNHVGSIWTVKVH